MIIEKRTLPIGVEHNGIFHRDLEIRNRLVKDLIAASGSDLVAENKNCFEVCCLASQIVKLGEISQDEITGELIMEMNSDDFDVLADAAEVARQRAASFRGKSDSDKEIDSCADEAGVSAG
jgi:hypothetical protein